MLVWICALNLNFQKWLVNMLLFLSETINNISYLMASVSLRELIGFNFLENRLKFPNMLTWLKVGYDKTKGYILWVAVLK